MSKNISQTQSKIPPQSQSQSQSQCLSQSQSQSQCQSQCLPVMVKDLRYKILNTDFDQIDLTIHQVLKAMIQLVRNLSLEEESFNVMKMLVMAYGVPIVIYFKQFYQKMEKYGKNNKKIVQKQDNYSSSSKQQQQDNQGVDFIEKYRKLIVKLANIVKKKSLGKDIYQLQFIQKYGSVSSVNVDQDQFQQIDIEFINFVQKIGEIQKEISEWNLNQKEIKSEEYYEFKIKIILLYRQQVKKGQQLFEEDVLMSKSLKQFIIPQQKLQQIQQSLISNKQNLIKQVKQIKQIKQVSTNDQITKNINNNLSNDINNNINNNNINNNINNSDHEVITNNNNISISKTQSQSQLSLNESTIVNNFYTRTTDHIPTNMDKNTNKNTSNQNNNLNTQITSYNHNNIYTNKNNDDEDNMIINLQSSTVDQKIVNNFFKSSIKQEQNTVKLQDCSYNTFLAGLHSNTIGNYDQKLQQEYMREMFHKQKHVPTYDFRNKNIPFMSQNINENQVKNKQNSQFQQYIYSSLTPLPSSSSPFPSLPNKQFLCCRTYFTKQQSLPFQQNLTTSFLCALFPFKKQKQQKILQTICSFLNQSGGTLYIGIAYQNNKYVVVGNQICQGQKQTVYRFFRQLNQNIQPEILMNKMYAVQFVPVKQDKEKGKDKKFIPGTYVIKVTVKYGVRSQIYSYKQAGKDYFPFRNNADIVYFYGRELMGEIKRRYYTPMPVPISVHDYPCLKPQIGQPLNIYYVDPAYNGQSQSWQIQSINMQKFHKNNGQNNHKIAKSPQKYRQKKQKSPIKFATTKPSTNNININNIIQNNNNSAPSKTPIVHYDLQANINNLPESKVYDHPPMTQLPKNNNNNIAGFIKKVKLLPSNTNPNTNPNRNTNPITNLNSNPNPNPKLYQDSKTESSSSYSLQFSSPLPQPQPPSHTFTNPITVTHVKWSYFYISQLTQKQLKPVLQSKKVQPSKYKIQQSEDHIGLVVKVCDQQNTKLIRKILQKIQSKYQQIKNVKFVQLGLEIGTNYADKYGKLKEIVYYFRNIQNLKNIQYKINKQDRIRVKYYKDSLKIYRELNKVGIQVQFYNQ